MSLYLMQRSKSASSSSRPSTGPSPLAHASKPKVSVICRPSGMSLAITFHVARELSRARFSHCTWDIPRKAVAALGISFAVLDNPEPLYLLELLGQTAFFGTPWGTQEYPRYRFNWLNTQHVSDAE